MDEHLDELRQVRAELVARSERLRLWTRLAGARMDLLTAQVCPPATADEVAEDELSELADLVLGTGPATTTRGEDRVGALLALREARRDLVRRREHLDDLVCWSTAELLLEAAAPRARARVPGQRSARPGTAPRDAPGVEPRLGGGRAASARLVVVAGAAADGPGAVTSTAETA
ncbi:hypothetical protein [uncultured Pseudokineococcus sp.]|uniref:hypothetical protein n=1 Tax=uncultured Pseudokineococcus sp. TaxID=1642928 RepID=UPI00260A190F|nr:hypothetical protein [uncultured Pseudokineococcus sp.]